MTLTLFTIPKPFQGHINTIQRNAIQSWLQLRPACEIILMGDDEGTAEIAQEFGIKHIPQVTCNEYGTPLVNDLFDKIKQVASHNLLCYINTDIMLMSDFRQAIEQMAHYKQPFLLAGQRYNVDIQRVLNFEQNWEKKFRAEIFNKGEWHPPWGIDYFVFPRNFWDKILPFAIGRFYWDNWLLYQARVQNATLIDATPAIMAVHQNHNYAHIKGGKKNSPERDRNFELAGNGYHNCNLHNATHVLTESGLKKALSWNYLLRRLVTLPIFYPFLHSILKFFLKITYPIRVRLGLIVVRY